MNKNQAHEDYLDTCIFGRPFREVKADLDRDAEEGIRQCVELWWGKVKDSIAWSGFVGMTWEELWPEAQADLTRIYLAAVEEEWASCERAFNE